MGINSQHAKKKIVFANTWTISLLVLFDLCGLYQNLRKWKRSSISCKIRSTPKPDPKKYISTPKASLFLFNNRGSINKLGFERY